MEIVVGSDHGGYGLKLKVREWLEGEEHKVKDIGCHSRESCDYPDFAEKTAKVVARNDKLGIVFCGTGIGVCMAANKVKGIRAALVYDAFTGRMAREHNNANVLCLGGRTTEFEKAREAIAAFLGAKFAGERHGRRVKKIMDLEK